ncbi:winged helix-turn-helix domain-containing protein [Shewanella sp.]|uniref:winged helix-turn-helix domain-containing protein n=1 Tax=Shewanella sp. TaxID=50422 RepID=UPI003F3AC6F7
MTVTIPRYQAMMPAVLTALADGQLNPLKPVCDNVAALYGFSEEPLNLTLLSGKQTHIHSRIGRNKTYLINTGLIHQPKRGEWQLTAASAQALDMQYARKGVFITTSSFSKAACHNVSRIEKSIKKRIVLIDGMNWPHQ